MALTARHHGSQSREMFTMCLILARNTLEETSFLLTRGKMPLMCSAPSTLLQSTIGCRGSTLASAKDSSSTLADAGKEVDYRRDISAMKSELMKRLVHLNLQRCTICSRWHPMLLYLARQSRQQCCYGLSGAMIGGALLALFWQQCGWLAHDFLHHQVFKNCMYNNFAGLVIGNVLQGFSTSWWKMKRNHHHASPNVVHTQADILTMPLLS